VNDQVAVAIDELLVGHRDHVVAVIELQTGRLEPVGFMALIEELVRHS
jgi:hypothetical protein